MLKTTFTLFFVSFCMAAHSMAAVKVGRIEKVSRDKKHALLRVDAKAGLKKNDKLFISPNCSLSLMKVKNNTAIASSKECREQASLKTGSVLQINGSSTKK